MRAAEDIRQPVGPAMSTTLTPIAIARRQEGAMMVATTNAELVADERQRHGHGEREDQRPQAEASIASGEAG
jgi:hypothetical protein